MLSVEIISQKLNFTSVEKNTVLNCVLNYTDNGQITSYRLWEFFKSFFGRSDYQKSKRILTQHLYHCTELTTKNAIRKRVNQLMMHFLSANSVYLILRSPYLSPDVTYTWEKFLREDHYAYYRYPWKAWLI